MKLVITGPKDLIVDSTLIEELSKFFRIEDVQEVVSCGDGSVDEAGEEWAEIFLLKKTIIIQADWKKHGKTAESVRNAKVAKYADQLLLIWDGVSKSSSSMKKEMIKLDKPVYEVILRG